MLVLVVGPSGAGKDTVLRLARQALHGDPRFHFVRRVITRPAEVGGEDHEAVSEAEFATRFFAMQWHAHGLHYGIPADIVEPLGRGVVVVANVSRGVVAHAAARFPVRVIEVTAPVELRARRLAMRGREATADIASRLARSIPLPAHVATVTLVNDATPAECADRFVVELRSIAG